MKSKNTHLGNFRKILLPLMLFCVSSAIVCAQTQPSNISLIYNSGQAAIFTFDPNGGRGASGYWQYSADGGDTWTTLASWGSLNGNSYQITNIGGGNYVVSTLSIDNPSLNIDGYLFRCWVVGGGNSIYSSNVKLSVLPIKVSPPSNSSINPNANTMFGVAVESYPDATLQWQVSTDGGNSWSNLTDDGTYSGCTGNLLGITGASISMNGYLYRCIVTNPWTVYTSGTAVLAVGDAPIITLNPVDYYALSGETGRFYINATSSLGLTYQWQVSVDSGVTWNSIGGSGSLYSGQTTNELQMDTGGTLAPMNGRKYRCIVSNGVGTATSSAATLIVGNTQTITSQPASLSVSAGENATFSVSVLGIPAPTCQWQRNYVNITDDDHYSGATTPTLNITNVTTDMDGAVYRCVIIDSRSPLFNTYSANATLTVNPVAPTFTIQPAGQSVSAGQSAIFAVMATGKPAPTYQWQVSINGFSPTWNNVSNATAATLTLTAVTAGMSGYQYRCVITNPAGSLASNPVTLTVSPAPVGSAAPSITTQPQDEIVFAGQKTFLWAL